MITSNYWLLVDNLRVNSYQVATTFAPNSGETMSASAINSNSSTRLTSSQAGRRSVIQFRMPSPDDTFINSWVVRGLGCVFLRRGVVRVAGFLCRFMRSFLLLFALLHLSS
jgi:hypothetical protein